MVESHEDLSSQVEYPLAFALTLAGALFVLGMELAIHYLKSLMAPPPALASLPSDRSNLKPVTSSAGQAESESTGMQRHHPVEVRVDAQPQSQAPSPTSPVDPILDPLTGEKVLDGTSSFVNAVLTDFSIAIHSVIIGIALGVSVDVETIEVLTAAFAFHQVRVLH